MGLYLSLNLTPTMPADQWDRFWCDSLQILREFPLRLLRASKYKTSYGFQKIWTDKLTASDKHGDYWEIAGDAESLIFAEPVRLYRNIEYYQQKWRRLQLKKQPAKDDPLFCKPQDFAKTSGDIPLSGIQVFHKKTQGYPYHYAIVAIATLAEHRFPLHSLAWGDLRPVGCNSVRQWLSSLYNENLMLPICLDAARLWNRIEGACGDISTTMKRFEERFIGTAAQRIHRMLAESRETTMQKLAEDLLHYETVTLGLMDLSKSFLEATDDLDLFLDLIELRNSLAASKKARKKDQSIIKREDILRMLVKGFVTYSQWQGEEIRTLRRWLDLEGGVVQTINATLLKMSTPDFFDYYCSEQYLLEAFVRREPAKLEKFNQVLRDTLEENLETEEVVKDFVRTMEERADAQTRRFEPVADDADNGFVRFIKEEASLQSELREPLTEENVAVVGRYFGYHVHQMQRIASGMENAKNLTDPTGNNQRGVLLAIMHQNDVRLLEDALLEIERTDDTELLKLFASLAPCLFTELFRLAAPIIFGEGFEMGRSALWHILNKPIWWQTFREHRNDGLSEERGKVRRKRDK